MGSVQQSQGLDSLMAGLDPQALDLLKKLLVFSSDQRISAGKALLHPYFSDFGFTPLSVSPTSDSMGGHSMSETSNSGSSEPNTSLSPNNVSVNTSLSPTTNASTSFSSHETSGDSLGDLSGNMADA